MKAIFKPTGFVFKFEDRYFVQAQYATKAVNGFDECAVLAVLEGYSDALAFAEIVSKQVSVKAVHIFTRDEQIKTVYVRAKS